MIKWNDVDREIDELKAAVAILLKMANDLKAVIEAEDAADAAKVQAVAEALDSVQKDIEAFTSPPVDTGGSTGEVLD
jgi:hypothetical protein